VTLVRRLSSEKNIMSKEAASLDLQAAAYWRSVAQADRSEATAAAIKANEYTTAARQERVEIAEKPRRSTTLRPS
jgi:hypothetical protein